MPKTQFQPQAAHYVRRANMNNGKGDTYRPTDRVKFEAGWDRIFSKKKVKKLDCEFGKSIQPSAAISIVNTKGDKISLTSYQKNEIYRNAKRIKEGLSDILCTKEECRNPTEQNVKKMLGSEFKAREKIEIFKKSMKAIGADPKDCSAERLRR